MDSNGFSPFSLAVLRGHYDLALKIVEICQLQYHGNDPRTQRLKWKMAGGNDESDMSDYDGDELPIRSELVSDTFTIEDLGEVQYMVKSTTLPKTMIEWGCRAHRFDAVHEKQVNGSSMSLLEYAVNEDNLDLVKLLIKVGGEQTARLTEDEDEPTSYSINRRVFQKAIELGRTGILAEMISSTGAGIPWNKLIKTSGLELKTKPKYYQGLSVGGKKRADWAQAPGGMEYVTEDKTPPLLQAAKAGNVETVEWLMSDAPMRHYRTWKEGNEKDRRVKTLGDAEGGFEGRIGKWLGAGSEFSSSVLLFYKSQ